MRVQSLCVYVCVFVREKEREGERRDVRAHRPFAPPSLHTLLCVYACACVHISYTSLREPAEQGAHSEEKFERQTDDAHHITSLAACCTEYELRTSELQLDLQHALRGNQQARDALARMNKGRERLACPVVGV